MFDLKADDRVGVIFCLVISFLQFEGKSIDLNEGKVDVDQYNKILYVLELILCYRQWLKLDSFQLMDDNSTFHNVELAIEKLLQDIIKLMP